MKLDGPETVEPKAEEMSAQKIKKRLIFFKIYMYFWVYEAMNFRKKI